MAAPASGLTGTNSLTLSALHTPQPVYHTVPLQHTSPWPPASNIQTSSNLSTLHLGVTLPMPQALLAQPHWSQMPLPSFIAPWGSAPQTSTSTLHPPQFSPQPSTSWDTLRSLSTPPGCYHHTADSHRSQYHHVSATHFPVTLSSQYTPQVSLAQDSITAHTAAPSTHQFSAPLLQLQHNPNILTQQNPVPISSHTLNLPNQDLSATTTTQTQASTAADTSSASSVQQMAASPMDYRLPANPVLYDDLQFEGSPVSVTSHTPASRTQQSPASSTQRTPGSPERQHTQAFRTSHVSAPPFLHTPAYSAQQTASPLQQIPDSPSRRVHVPAATVFSDDDDINVDSTMSDTPGVHVSCNDQASSSRELRDQHNKHEDGDRELGERPSHCEVEQSDWQRPDEKQEPGKKKRRGQTETRKQREEEHTKDPTAPSALGDSGPRPEDEARRLDKKLKRAMIKSRNSEESSVDTGTTKHSGRRPEDGTPRKRAKKNSKTGEGSSVGTRIMKDSGCRPQSGSPQKRAKKTSKNDEESSVGTHTMKDSGRRLHDETRRLDKKPKRAKTKSTNGKESSVGAEREIQDGTQNLDDVEGGTTEAKLQGERKLFAVRHKQVETGHKKDQEIIHTLQDKIKELEDTVQSLQKTNKKLEDSLMKQRNESKAREGVIHQETDEDAKEYKQWRKKTRELEEEHRKYRERNKKLDEECQRYRDKTRQLEEERRKYTERSRQLAHSTTSEDTAGTSRTPSKPRKPAVYTTSESEATAFGMVRLTSDHEVFIHNDKLQIAVNAARSRRVPCDGTKLARRLIKLFFTQTEREHGSISTDPKDGLQELNPEITKAIIDCCLSKDNTTSRGKVRNSMASSLTAERCRARNQARTATRSKGKKVAKKTAAGTD